MPRPVARRRPRPPRIVTIGDLMLDAVIRPSRPLERGTDVPGSVALRQGGSAANTARWLARLGARSTLVTAVGRDAVGRALTDALRRDGVSVQATRVSSRPTGRIGVVVMFGGERSFVADRGAADELAPTDLKARWFATDLLHLPAYSLIGTPLGDAGRRAIELAREAGALISLDLASAAPLLAKGRRAAHRLVADAAPDVLFATAAEAEAYLGGSDVGRLVDSAPLAIVKRGAGGATILSRQEGSSSAVLRFEVATPPLTAADTTGAGDAFDAGFLVAFMSAASETRFRQASLRRAVMAGHRAAARQLRGGSPELSFG